MTMLLAGGISLLPSPHKSPESYVMSGETGWTVRGPHLHHALGTSQVWASGPDPCLLRGLGCNCISGVLGAHLDHPEPSLPQGGARGLIPVNTIVHVEQ